MYRSRAFLLSLLIVVAGSYGLSGCSESNGSGAKTVTTGDAPGITAPQPNGSTVTARLEDVPADLKHQAFEYYGLGRTAAVDMERKAMGQTLTGGRICRVVEISGGKAVFEAEYTGALADLGTEKLSVEKDGIYTIGLSIGEITPARTLSLPADLSAGKSWNSKNTIKHTNGTTIEADHTHKVIGPRKVKTKAGEFDAILIEAGGPTVQNGQKLRVQMKYWLVKDVGPVKMEVIYDMSGKKETFLIEATKVNK